MKITYIHHSGFLVELEHIYLLFDYMQGDLPELDPEKMLLVLSSHRHGDHFVPEIFQFAGSHHSTRYLLSYDIKERSVPKELLSTTDLIKYNETLTLTPDQGLKEILTVETFKSTDQGVAFLITTEGKTVYHAGDLNNWTWNGEPDSWNHNMQTNYRREIEKMKGRTVDIAFLPVDPRLEDKFYLGIDDFMRQVGAGLVFPMHLWGDFDTISRLKRLPVTAEYRDKIVEIHGDNEVFDLGDRSEEL